MDEKVETPNAIGRKRSRSNEELKKGDKDLTSSSCSSGQHSPYDNQETNVSACSNNSSVSNNNNNSDSGLSSKMEESSFGDADSMMMTIDSKADDEEDLNSSPKAASGDNILQEESMESLTAACAAAAESDGETPCSSSHLIKRSKRNRSRNYRKTDRSTSSEDEGERKRNENNDVGSKMAIEVPPAHDINSEEALNPVDAANSIAQEESMESLADNGESTTADVEKPCTSSKIVIRSKRNRSRNNRTSERSASTSSSSSSSSSSQISFHIVQPAAESNENNDPDVQMVERTSSPASSEQSEESFALPSPDFPDEEDDDDDDDSVTDFLGPILRGRNSSDYVSPDSADSVRIKEKDEEVNKLLNKQKPAYTWSAAYELMRREHGLSGDGRTSLRNGFTYGFNNRFYASRHVVERMKLSHVLRKHNGCVNCLNFNKSGDLLVTGSDDARLIVWDWAGNKVKHIWKSGHSSNIFQSKFVPTSPFIDIISAARDGRVRRSIVPSSGGKVQTSNLYIHRGPVHKLVICPDNPSEIISVGEDGFICSKDLREEYHKIDLLQVMSHVKKSRKVRLFSISHHPFAPEICVSGSDCYVRVYDKRSMKDPVRTMCPEHILEACTPSVTCCVYNNTGTEILASYSEENIYLFDNKNYVDGEYLHCYKGHYNQKTIKGVNFFGPNCEYVISGSDCGNIFYWDKNTEAILNFMPGDTAGVVNCLEPHPTTPILATSGLDHHIKIWTPSAEKYPPDLTKLTSCVRRNLRRTVIDEAIQFDYNQLQYFIRQTLCRHRRRNRERNNDDEDDSDDSPSSSVELHTDNDDSDDDDDEDVSNLQRLNCGTQ